MNITKRILTRNFEVSALFIGLCYFLTFSKILSIIPNMNKKIFKIASFNPDLNNYLPYTLAYDSIFQSIGLSKHIEKRHPECLPYLDFLPSIIEDPDYIGINPNEKGTSFELVKVMSENVQVGIKLDISDDYLYVATLHTITEGKLKHGLRNGRLKKIDKP